MRWCEAEYERYKAVKCLNGFLVTLNQWTGRRISLALAVSGQRRSRGNICDGVKLSTSGARLKTERSKMTERELIKAALARLLSEPQKHEFSGSFEYNTEVSPIERVEGEATLKVVDWTMTEHKCDGTTNTYSGTKGVINNAKTYGDYLDAVTKVVDYAQDQGQTIGELLTDICATWHDFEVDEADEEAM